MKSFKNEKASELYFKSLVLDSLATKKENANISDELKVEAVSLRIMASDLEDGLITEDEIEI